MQINKKTLLLCLLLVAPVTHAAIVTINYSGTINRHSGLASDLHTLLPAGQTFSGSYTYDSSFPATYINNENDISYTGAISKFTVNFGELYASLDAGSFRYINDKERPPLLFETEPTAQDTYVAEARTGIAALPTNVDTNIVLANHVSETLDSGYHLSWLRLDVTDRTANMLTDALLSRVPPDISGLNMQFELGYQLDCCTGRTEVHGTIDSLTVSSVPTPPAIWLLLLR